MSHLPIPDWDKGVQFIDAMFSNENVPDVVSKQLTAALRRSIQLTNKGKFTGGVTVAGELKIGKRKYQVTVKVDGDREDWYDAKQCGINSPT